MDSRTGSCHKAMDRRRRGAGLTAQARTYTGQRMNNEYAWWLLIVGLAVGAVVTWLLIGGPPRGEEDVDDAERTAEAGWISATIEQAGGVAPAELVEQVLDLHRAYLRRTPPDSALDGDPWDAPVV